MREDKHIDDLFKRELKNYSKDPPVQVWESLSASLGKGRRISIYTNLSRIAAGIAVLLMFGLGWYLIYNKTGDVRLIAEEFERDSIGESLHETEIIIHDEKRDNAGDKSIFEEKSDIASNTGFQSEKSRTSEIYNKYKTDDFQVNDFASTFVAEDSIMHFERIEFSSLAFSSLHSFQISPSSGEKDLIKIMSSGGDFHPDEFIVYESDEPAEPRFWFLSGVAAPEYSYRTVHNGNMAGTEYFNNAENPAFTWSGGLQIGYEVTKRLHVQSGLIYSRSGIQIDNLETFGRVEPEKFYSEYSSLSGTTLVNVGNSIGSIKHDDPGVLYMSYNSTEEDIYRSYFRNLINSPLDETNSINRLDAGLIQYLDFLEIPVNFRYRLNNGKIKFNLLGGFSSNVLMGNKILFLTEGIKKETGKTENIRSVNYSGNIGFSVDYKLSDHFMLLIEPRYKYYLHSINEKELINARPYLIGVFTGLRYRF